MLSALVAWTAFLLPQEPDVRIELPDDPEIVQFSPHLSPEGQATTRPTAAAGAADMDGDGNADLWFLAGPGSAQGTLEIQMADAGHLGRYRAWHSYTERGYTDAATFHSELYSQDRILMADPSGPGLRMALFQTGPISGDPRNGTWYDMPNFWLGDLNIYEVETRNDSADAHDDVVVLIDRNPGGTLVKKLVIEGQYSPQVTSVVEVAMPLELRNLTLLDLDGDGRTDFAATAPGVGVVVFRDDGTGRFSPLAAVADPTPICDMFAADLLGSGRDALGLCVDFGVLIGCFEPTGVLPYWLPAPPAAGPLAGAELLVDLTGKPQLVMVPRDGRGIAVHRFDRPYAAFAEPVHLVFPAPPPVSRPGLYGVLPRLAPARAIGTAVAPLTGISGFAADVDADGDLDLVLQRSSAAAWITLPNTSRSLRLEEVSIQDLGDVGETGFVKQEFTFPLPAGGDPEPYSTVEAAVYRVDPADGGTTFYWGRLLPQVDPVGHTVSFFVYTQTDPAKLSTLYDPYMFRDGITAGGEAAITVHGIDGSRRFESVHLYHEPGGEGNGSGSGATWTMTSAPPLPTTPQALLPWSPGEG